MKKILSVLLVSVFFSGCSPYYNLFPKYDEENKTVDIANFRIGSVIDHRGETRGVETPEQAMVSGYSLWEVFETNDEECTIFSVAKGKVDGSVYYETSAKEDILLKHNRKCDIEKIGNLYFLACSGKDRTTSEVNESVKGTAYYITTSAHNEHGYGSKTTLFLGSKHCYAKLKSHFSSITEAKYIEKIKTDS